MDICDTVDFILCAKHDKKATLQCFKKVMASSGTRKKVAIDKSDADKAAMDDGQL
jgi:transposase-like protein